ncbi:MAG TPA: class I SAM-dependent methyltransferase [Gammaproteobacteria bacterium]|nr:class I SAM-dependent methyltransferase [Gammaproteobacteria bacterium]
MHERRFDKPVERLRDPHRVALMDVDAVLNFCLDGVDATRVLDVGTGSALFAERFATRDLAVAGSDVNPAMLEAARQYLPEAEFREAPAEALPWPDGSFDLVFLGHVLHETDDPVAALREARRVCTRRVAVLEWPYREEEDGPPIDHRLAPAVVEKHAREAGFERTRVVNLSHMVLFLLEKDD